MKLGHMTGVCWCVLVCVGVCGFLSRVTILPVCESTIGKTILDEKAWSQPCVTL